MEKRRKVWTRKQPIAVTIVAWGIVILFLVRLFQVLEPLVRMHVLEHGIKAPLMDGARLTAFGAAILTSAAYLAASIVGIVVLVGFLRLHRWAWVLLMAWTGASLLIGLVEYFYSRPNYLVMASNTVIAVALNQVEVQRIFQIRIASGDQGTGPQA
jgi:roadblock/LC7 domain-containing protein